MDKVDASTSLKDRIELESIWDSSVAVWSFDKRHGYFVFQMMPIYNDIWDACSLITCKYH